MKVVLGIPTALQPTQAFLDSLRTLQPPASHILVERVVVTGNFVPGQRELIVRKAREMNADILVMLDDDIVLPPHALIFLIDSLTNDTTLAAVGALYYSRDGSQPMAVNNWSSGNISNATIPAFTNDRVVAVDGIGFGCVALRMAALEALSEPLFGVQILMHAAESRVRLCNEDYLLCERLRTAGWHIALDARIQCGHYDRNSKQIYPEHWESNEITDHERTLIRDQNGTIRMVEHQAHLKCIPEEYQSTHLDYIFR